MQISAPSGLLVLHTAKRLQIKSAGVIRHPVVNFDMRIRSAHFCQYQILDALLHVPFGMVQERTIWIISASSFFSSL